jgi:hypothetical protein
MITRKAIDRQRRRAVAIGLAAAHSVVQYAVRDRWLAVR